MGNKEKDGNLGVRSDSLKHEKWKMGSSRPVLWRWELSEWETVWFRPKQDWKGPDGVMPEAKPRPITERNPCHPRLDRGFTRVERDLLLHPQSSRQIGRASCKERV